MHQNESDLSRFFLLFLHKRSRHIFRREFSNGYTALLFDSFDSVSAMNVRFAYVLYTFRITNVELLMLSTHVPFQITRLTKSFIAHVAFVRFLVRVNTHVVF